MDIFTVLLIYLDAVNLTALAAMGIDKHRARVHRRRVSEAALMVLALLGGGVGILGGMLLFHHKTRKPRFYIGVPVILVFEILFFVMLIYVTLF